MDDDTPHRSVVHPKDDYEEEYAANSDEESMEDTQQAQMIRNRLTDRDGMIRALNEAVQSRLHEDLSKYEFKLSKPYEKQKWIVEVSDTTPPPAAEHEFPNQLGPFGILETELELSAEGDFYTVTTDERLQPLLYNDEIMSMGTMSPPHRITLSAEALRAARIPENAKSFRWAYPLVGIGSLSDKQKAEYANLSPELCFLVFGGYIYFNEMGKPIKSNAIGLGNGLFFSKPKRWSPNFTRYLFNQGRFQDITIQSMRDQGAYYYCWILPGETLHDRNGNSKVITGNGAFVYLFHRNPDDYSEKDRYFVIEDAPNVLERSRDERPIQTFSFAKQKRQQRLERGESMSSNADSEPTTCVVCLCEERKIMFVPCNHFCCCAECAIQVKECPMCRGPVANRLNVYL
eukprot:c4656_g1_i1.p1 GENE.c4656_g1_i1~~c4656_g1_i1.p1  ORF type:complete len:402 (+),score=80.70 c4656_g1_i1:42-1247(+)